MDKHRQFFGLEGRFQRLIDNLAAVIRNAGRPYVPPPKVMPPSLVDGYTMQGRVPVIDWYLNNKPDPKSIGSVVMYRADNLRQVRLDVSERRYKSYGPTNDHLHAALQAYDIEGRFVLIMGSAYPQFEAFCLHYGGKPITIEYNVRCSDSEELSFFSPAQFEALNVKGDAAISISSFEHDGLGRYGDPLDPDGDLKAMAKLRTQLATGSLAFVSVPLGRDAVVWNAHRIYGPARLPAFLAGWEVVSCFGDELGLIHIEGGSIRIDRERWNETFPLVRTGKEWVFVLRSP